MISFICGIYKQTNKQTNSKKKRSDLWFPGGGVVVNGSERRGNWVKVVKSYKPPAVR